MGRLSASTFRYEARAHNEEIDCSQISMRIVCLDSQCRCRFTIIDNICNAFYKCLSLHARSLKQTRPSALYCETFSPAGMKFTAAVERAARRDYDILRMPPTLIAIEIGLP